MGLCQLWALVDSTALSDAGAGAWAAPFVRTATGRSVGPARRGDERKVESTSGRSESGVGHLASRGRRGALIKRLMKRVYVNLTGLA